MDTLVLIHKSHLKPMENKHIDLSALRISRNQEQQDGPPKKTGTYIGIAVSILILGIAGFFLYQSLFSPAIEVTLTTVSWTSPSQSNAVLTASGYVVAQRKAAVASKGTGRLVYLGVVEGDRVKKNQIIARLEDSDVRASLEQAKANLRLNEADLKDAQQSLARQKSLLDKGLANQSEYDGAEQSSESVTIGIARSETLRGDPSFAPSACTVSAFSTAFSDWFHVHPPFPKFRCTRSRAREPRPLPPRASQSGTSDTRPRNPRRHPASRVEGCRRRRRRHRGRSARQSRPCPCRLEITPRWRSSTAGPAPGLRSAPMSESNSFIRLRCSWPIEPELSTITRRSTVQGPSAQSASPSASASESASASASVSASPSAMMSSSSPSWLPAPHPAIAPASNGRRKPPLIRFTTGMLQIYHSRPSFEEWVGRALPPVDLDLAHVSEHAVRSSPLKRPMSNVPDTGRSQSIFARGPLWTSHSKSRSG